MKLTMVELVLYQEHFKTKQDIINIIKDKGSIKKYAIILHDKDGIKSHYHVALHFGVSYDTSRLLKYFNVTSQALQRIKGRWHDVLAYLTHSNAPDKYQYSPDEITANFDVQEAIIQSQNETSIKDDIIAYSNLEMTYSQLWKQLTPADRMKHKKDIDKASDIRNQNIKMRGHRNMKVYYITGASGMGKTTLAKYYTEKILKLDYYISSSSNDPLCDYMGQEVIILDDLRGSSFSFADLLKMTDNHTQSSVKSRYYNKAIDCKIMFITSIKQVFDLYSDEVTQGEPLTQFLRRITEFIDIDDEGRIFTKQVDWYHYHESGGSVSWANRKQLPLDLNTMISAYQLLEDAQKTMIDIIANFNAKKTQD